MIHYGQNYREPQKVLKTSVYLFRSYFLGKTLLVCKTALKDFKSIVAVVGGPTEQERAKLVTLQSFVPITDLFL